MIDEHGDAMAIDDLRPVANAEQIGDRLVLISAVGLFFIDQRTRIFHDASAFRDRRGGVAAGGVDCGGANDQTHTYVGSKTRSIAVLPP